MDTINILAILVAAAVSFVIGGLWYSPMLFGNRWMALTGVTEDGEKRYPMGKVFGLAFVASLIIAFNLAMFLGPERTVFSGALYGFLAGFGWVAMGFAINDLFEQRSSELWLINAGYHSVSFTVMGAIIGIWH